MSTDTTATRTNVSKAATGEKAAKKEYEKVYKTALPAESTGEQDDDHFENSNINWNWEPNNMQNASYKVRTSINLKQASSKWVIIGMG